MHIRLAKRPSDGAYYQWSVASEERLPSSSLESHRAAVAAGFGVTLDEVEIINSSMEEKKCQELRAAMTLGHGPGGAMVVPAPTEPPAWKELGREALRRAGAAGELSAELEALLGKLLEQARD